MRRARSRWHYPYLGQEQGELAADFTALGGTEKDSASHLERHVTDIQADANTRASPSTEYLYHILLGYNYG
jgi:hypothetical protein